LSSAQAGVPFFLEVTPMHAEQLRIPVESGWLEGELALPEPTCGLVVFAHGSGSSRRSPRNQFVAGMLREAGLATLLMDLLTPDEETLDFERGHLRFDIPFLAGRLWAATLWARRHPRAGSLPLGYFGASTGAAAALLAAADAGSSVGAVVSRGGRPDLAGRALARVQAPTLLVVGSRDREVLALNREALAKLACEAELRIVDGATHLFEEPGALEEVARLAAFWFRKHLGSPEWAPDAADRLDAPVRGE
jgi:putative phosphoribosyl transferase